MAYIKTEINEEELFVTPKKAKNITRRTFLVVGNFGTGKTFSCRTIPKDQSVLHFDFDGKTVRLIEEIEKQERDNYTFVQIPWDITDAKASGDKLTYAMKKIKAQKSESSEPFIYDWIILDTLSSLFNIYAQVSHTSMKGENKFNLNFDKQGFVRDRVWRVLQTCMSCAKYTILFAHPDVRDNYDGTSRVMPASYKSLSENIPTVFNNYFHSLIEGEGTNKQYIWLTQSEGITASIAYAATCDIDGVPDRVPQDWNKLINTDWNK